MRVKFWLKSALQNSLIIVGGGLLYVALLMAMEPMDSIQDVFQVASIYLLAMGAMLSILLEMSVFKVNLPLAIGCGSTRKEAFLGRQLYRAVFTALLTVTVIGLAALAGDKGMAPLDVYTPIVLAVMLVTGSVGSVLGAFSTKLGKTGLVILGIVLGVIAMLLIMAGFIGGAVLADTANWSRWMVWLAPVAAAVVYGLSIIPEHKTIYKYNVKL